MKYWFASFYRNGLHDSKKSYGRIFKVRESNKELAEKLERLSKRGYFYRWPDGWWVGIQFKKIDSEKEYKKLKKKVCGDLGYGWMIDNIIDHGSPRDVDVEYMNEVLRGEHLDS